MPILTRVSEWFSAAPSEVADEPEARSGRESAVVESSEVRRRPVVSSHARDDEPTERISIVQPEHAIETLNLSLEPLRRQLLAHPLYDAVSSLERLRAFMGVHVYAVWDFMCLAKRLQRDFTSLGPLWLPPRLPALARFINELVLGEESDLDPEGSPISHLQLYLAAMDEVGASTDSINEFLGLIERGAAVEVALSAAETPLAARRFVRRTLACAGGASTTEVLASFLYGREDLIPEMFSRLLPRWREAASARSFAYYVARHIELDGDAHGPAARRALMELCGSEPAAWQAAQQAAETAISARIVLWNAVYSTMP